MAEFARLVADLEGGAGGAGGAGSAGSAGGSSPEQRRAQKSAASGGEQVEQGVRDAFAAFDTNRNGSIDARELRGALRHLGLDSSAKTTVQVLGRYDRDGNASLDLREFASLVADVRKVSGAGSSGGGSAAAAPGALHDVAGIQSSRRAASSPERTST